VIGGGVAGLSAATALAARGVHVTLLEARPTLGGRCSTFTDPATGERVDNGQHVLIGCYHETFRFLQRIGSSGHVRVQNTLALRIVDRNGASSVLRCPSWPAPLHLLGGLLGWTALAWRDRLSSLRMLPALAGRAPNAGQVPVDVGRVPQNVGRVLVDPANTETVRQWLRRHGQSERLIELLWEPLAIAALNQPIDAAAAGPFREVVRRMFTANRRDSTLVLPIVPLTDLFVSPAVALLRRNGGEVIESSPAKVVVDSNDPGAIVQARDARLEGDAIVCAVPWFALPDVLPDVDTLRPIIDAARCTAASPIVTVNLWLDRQVVDDEFVGLPGRHMQWIFDKGRMFGETAAHLSLVSSGAGDIVARSNFEIVMLAMGEMRAALPSVHDAVVKRAVVVREKRATFSLAPGQPQRPATTTGVPGLFLAGDWIDTGLPATIESAVMSGHRAAAAVLDYLHCGSS
jgi:squalene-associated FAD-dependent desaturase